MDSNAWLRITCPASLSTDILPTVPSALGSRMTRDFPTSSTVILNAVPRTPIRAVGVRISTFCAFSFAMLPLAYLTVPSVAFHYKFRPSFRIWVIYKIIYLLMNYVDLLLHCIFNKLLIQHYLTFEHYLCIQSAFSFKTSLFFALSIEAFPFCFTTLPILSNSMLTVNKKTS